MVLASPSAGLGPRNAPIERGFNSAYTGADRRRQRWRFLSGARMRSWLGPEVTAAAGPQACAHASAPAGFANGAIVFSGVCRPVPDGRAADRPRGRGKPEEP